MAIWGNDLTWKSPVIHTDIQLLSLLSKYIDILDEIYEDFCFKNSELQMNKGKSPNARGKK